MQASHSSRRGHTARYREANREVAADLCLCCGIDGLNAQPDQHRALKLLLVKLRAHCNSTRSRAGSEMPSATSPVEGPRSVVCTLSLFTALAVAGCQLITGPCYYSQVSATGHHYHGAHRQSVASGLRDLPHGASLSGNTGAAS